MSAKGPTRDIALHTEGLCIGYKNAAEENILFKDLDLSLYAGQVVCFMGPNGIGKSTLIRTLAGLQKPLRGKVFYTRRDALSRNLSVVLTDKIQAADLSVYELITFGRYPYVDWRVKLSPEDKKIIEDAIDQVNIRHLLSKKLYALSDGQMQMVMIARALALDGSIILLDEPTAHLDLNNRIEIMNVLNKLSRTTNKAILVATHELDLALQTADLVWLAGNTKTIVTGIPEDLVLDGSFDNVFQFKGFDLKTGKIQHKRHRETAVKVIGEGAALLWTRNALERNGFEISDTAKISIEIKKSNTSFQWEMITPANDSNSSSFISLSALLDSIL